MRGSPVLADHRELHACAGGIACRARATPTATASNPERVATARVRRAGAGAGVTRALRDRLAFAAALAMLACDAGPRAVMASRSLDRLLARRRLRA